MKNAFKTLLVQHLTTANNALIVAGVHQTPVLAAVISVTPVIRATPVQHIVNVKY